VFGLPSDGAARYCAVHRPEGARDLKHRACARVGCERQPSFAPPGSRAALRCRAHKEKGDDDVKHRARKRQARGRGAARGAQPSDRGGSEEGGGGGARAASPRERLVGRP